MLRSIGILEFYLSTKLTEAPENNAEIVPWSESKIQNSLTPLRMSQLQGILLHRPHQIEGKTVQEIIRFLSHLKISKIINKIGFSIYAQLGLVSILFKFAQAPVNLVDKFIEQVSRIEKLVNQVLRIMRDLYFLQGFLLMKKNQIPAKFKLWESIFSQWNKWLCHNRKISGVRAYLNYVYSKANLDKVIIGIVSLKQSEELVEMIKEPMDTTYPYIFSNVEKLLYSSNWKY
jgi:aryl-alcohol dehydrogenase-like predicted oxidoreductase